jgi:hypothetical protein
MRKIRSWLTWRGEQSVELLVDTLQLGDLCSGSGEASGWASGKRMGARLDLSCLLLDFDVDLATLLVDLATLLVQWIQLGILTFYLCFYLHGPGHIELGRVSSLLFSNTMFTPF